MADRRLCLTGTPVQNKLDDVFALVKFLRLEPLDNKSAWTEYIGTPVKYGQPLGIARLQIIMKCITLRRTKESRGQDGQRILSLPPRRDELRYLKFDEQEQAIYDQFFTESKAEFNQLSDKNEVMKNYVGILQKILRLRQICDHFELVKGKGLLGDGQPHDAMSYEDAVTAIATEGITSLRAAIVFGLLREAATAQCVECGVELSMPATEVTECANGAETEGSSSSKRGRKTKGTPSRGPTRASSPTGSPQPVLTRCLHLFCTCCYRRSIHANWPKCAPDLSYPCSACQVMLLPSDAVEVNPDCIPDDSVKKKPGRREKRTKGVNLEEFHPSTKVKALLGDLVQFSKANRYSVNFDPSSLDVQMIDDQGNIADDCAVKTVVLYVYLSLTLRCLIATFNSSQWTSMLDK